MEEGVYPTPAQPPQSSSPSQPVPHSVTHCPLFIINVGQAPTLCEYEMEIVDLAGVQAPITDTTTRQGVVPKQESGPGGLRADDVELPTHCPHQAALVHITFV
mmetsp:Transcript_66925/g.160266  ORF Transcript_66925/g.160266 Transcript_66925/m.160266 type:complete len:103 (-) Transcript_66925:955-1263(-)